MRVSFPDKHSIFPHHYTESFYHHALFHYCTKAFSMLTLWTTEEVLLKTPCLISSHVALLFLTNMVTLIRNQGVQVAKIKNTGFNC